MPREQPLDIARPDILSRLAREGDGIEVSPVREHNGTAEVCEPDEATMWSVYIHRMWVGVTCIADYADEQDALDYARELLTVYPNLMAHGINNANSRSNKR